MNIKKLREILTAAERIRFLKLFAAVILMAFLEVVGIASILPFMQLAADPMSISENKWLAWIYASGGFSSTRSMLISLGFSVLALMAISNAFKVYTTWIQQKFVWDVAHQLSTRLLGIYLKQPYSYFLTKNSSDLLSNLAGEVGLFVNGVLIPINEVVSKLLVSLVISALLFLVSPQITLIMFGALGLTYIIIYLSRRQHLKKLGNERILANRKRYRSLREALNGIKSLKMYGVQSFFHNRFEVASELHSKIHPKIHLISTAPKYIIELIAFGGILGVLLFLLIEAKDVNNVIPVLSLFALSGYRLMPALQSVFSGATKYRHSRPVVDVLHRDLQLHQENSGQDTHQSLIGPLQKGLTIQNMSFSYPTNDFDTLSEVSLEITMGSTIALVGATGSGKTTLIDIICGLLYPQLGTVIVDDLPLTPQNANSWQQQCGYVPQHVFLFDDTVARNIAIGQADEAIDQDRLEAVSRMVDLYDFITKELPTGFQSAIGEKGIRLSGGQRQRLGLARALYRNPRVLILDEATSALDYITEHAVMESLKKIDDLTVIIIAHRLATVRHADCIFLLQNGSIIDKGTHEELMHSNDIFKEMVQLS